MSLVQGTAPQEIPYTKSFDIKFPPLFGDGQPVDASMPPVKVMVKKLPENAGLPNLLGMKV